MSAARIMLPAFYIAREEWRFLLRNRVALIASLLLFFLVMTSALVSYQQWRETVAMQQRYQLRNAQEFEAQPDRHPHRMAHYGQFVFRTPGPLAFFDFGIENFTGSMVYLEAHRQNSANFSAARQSSSLLRFGQLTPAFVLQTVSPLLIIFLAFACMTRERESGTLRLLIAQGIGGGTQLFGKIIGHSAMAIAFALPGLLTPFAMVTISSAALLPALLIVFGYLLYLLMWVLLAVLVSASVAKSRDALLVLMALWITSVILLPRIAPQLASAMQPLPTRLENDISINQSLNKIGDSHNPDDPYFAAFKAKVLAQYGVTRVEDLPVDIGGIVGAEGERLTSELFAEQAARIAAIEDKQNRVVAAFSVVSPVLALRQFSEALAVTDLSSYRHFILAVEAHRYAFVQGLNKLQAEFVKAEDQRISHTHWRELPRFDYPTPDAIALDAENRIGSAFAILSGWLIALLVLIPWVGRRMGRILR